MSKHTPGPWVVRHVPERYNASTYCIDWSAHQEEVAEIVHGEANARLIAAAPDLLAAAKGLLGLAERHGWLHVAVDAARAAIAKAEGEQS